MARGIQRDHRAGALLKELRENRGLSPEQLSHAIYGAGLGTISGQTIRRTEDKGAIPQVRNRFALAQFFDREVVDIWQPKRQVRQSAGTGQERVAA